MQIRHQQLGGGGTDVAVSIGDAKGHLGRAVGKKRVGVLRRTAPSGSRDKEQAFSWLDKAYEERSGYLMEIHLDPMFDPLRSDPRFPALVRRLGLASAPPTL